MTPAAPEGAPLRCDLHLHSLYSDGLLPPEALARQAAALGLTVIALCDHDTVDGLAPMARAVQTQNALRPAPPLTLVPGLEVSTGDGGRTHILCYGARPDDPALLRFLREAADDRRQRMQQMLARLQGEGVALTPDMQALPDAPSAGRAHLARALVQAGVVPGIKAAFDRYLNEGRPAYVPRRYLPTGEAVAFLHGLGYVPVLAHPMRSGLSAQALPPLLHEWQGLGLCGLEVYHPSASRRDVRALDALARGMGLLVTGGSDFHGDRASRARMGVLPSGWHAMAQDECALLRRLGLNP